MFKHLITISILFSLIGCSGKHFQPLTKREIVREVVYIALNIIDWKQTLDIKNHPGYYERNPLSPAHPHNDRINFVMTVGIVGHPLITWYLEPEKRVYWQTITTGVEAVVVYENYQLGLDSF